MFKFGVYVFDEFLIEKMVSGGNIVKFSYRYWKIVSFVFVLIINNEIFVML